MARITVTQVRQKIVDKQPFYAERCFGEVIKGLLSDVYAVYSYGRHYPLFVNISGRWFVNSDKSSRTTERQKQDLQPVRTGLCKATTTEMKAIVENKSMRGISLANFAVANRRRGRVR